MIKNLPQGWRVEELGNICKFINGYAFKSVDFQPFGIPIVRIGNLIDEKIDLNDAIFYQSNDCLTPYITIQDDILIAMSGATTGKIAFNDLSEKIYLNQRIGAIRVKREILFSKYLFNFLKKKKSYLLSVAGGSAQPNLSSSDIKKLKIPIPPLPQQEKIVKVLDNSSSLVEQQKQLIKKYDVFLKSKFIEMFGDPITNPMGWEIQKFDNIFTKITDGTHNSPPMSNSGYKYITAKHIKENKIDFERDETYISEEEHKKIFSRCSPKKGDILYIKDGATTGIACINTLEEEFSLLSSVALLKPSVKIKSEYIVSYLNNPTVKLDILQNMVGGAIKRLTIQKIKNLTIPMPPIELQNKFASIVEKIEAIKEKETQKLNHLETLHVSLMDKAFKGEIV